MQAARAMEQKQLASEEQFLTFRLHGQDYGITILKIQEIKGWDKVTPIPNSPAYVKGVLNLRGANAGQPWYDEEVRLAQQNHVVHYDFRMSAGQRLSPDQIDRVVALLKQAPKPVLIHCQAGADRTGLISAILRLKQGDSPEQARQQLSLRYGHFPYLGSSTIAMDQSFDTHLQARKSAAGAHY